MKIKYSLLILIPGLLIFASSCKVGPNYKRPATNLDSTYRFALSRDTNSIADLSWVSLFGDPVLQKLVEKGLKNNLDLRMAYERINQARASFKSARGDQWPQLFAEGNASAYRLNRGSEGGTSDIQAYTAVAGLSWEIDIWGKLRRAKEAARAQLFAQEAYQQAIRINLIAEIITGYFNLVELDNELRITNENITLREKSLELQRNKLQAGTASGLTVAQAEAELYAAKTQVPNLEILIAQQENAISILLGEPPHAIERGMTLLEQVIIPEIKTPGIPSQLILRRPDIIAAEQNLISANANIGVARAYMLPTLTISGSLGAGFDPTNLIYNATAGLLAPIFNGGKLRAEWERAKSYKEEILLNYQKTILVSLQEVSDALIAVSKQHEVVNNSTQNVAANQMSYDLSTQLYDAGYASFLDVLDAQRQLFSSQIDLSRYQSQQLIDFVRIYAALGGGWK